MPRAKLEAALSGVDWNSNVAVFLKDTANSEIIARANMRLAIWSRQLENTDVGNPALSFIREMQVAGHHVPALTSLALYKPAAASMRIVFETALYYTYFRKHPSELATLVRDKSYFVTKSEIIDYHKLHTPDFKVLEQCFGLVGRIEEWYGFVSSLIHGQIPGHWNTHIDFTKLKHVNSIIPAVTKAFQDGEEIVHYLFLCTVGRELWDGFSSPAKKQLLSGIAGDRKAALGLDAA
jgi:hypothetical protein